MRRQPPMNSPMNKAIVNSASYCLFLTAAFCTHSSAATTSRPNIVLIVADDLGFSDLGCYGGEIRTPHLDQLASEGLQFTQFYNCAVCNATRVAMLTGVYPRFGRGGLLRRDMVTVAEVLQKAGYATAMSGKWHLGGYPTRPIDRGFSEYYGVMIGAVNYFDPTLPDPPPMKHAGPSEPFVHNMTVIKSVAEGYYATDAFTDHAVEQIRTLSKGDRPFFLHLAYTAPHYPLQAPAEDIARYRGRYRDGYEVLRKERYHALMKLNLISEGWKLPGPDRKLGPWRYDIEPEAWKSVADVGWESEKMEVYAAMVDRMDQGVGRVLAALKESGVADETMVVFFSDNGGCASNSSAAAYEAYKNGIPSGSKDTYILGGPGWATAQSSPFRRYKTWTYEGGISTPMIVRWPGKIKAGSRTHAVGHVLDLMPTFLEVSGSSYPNESEGNEIVPMEGQSLVPILSGGNCTNERELGWYLYGSRAFRAGKWKIVWGVTAQRWELYNMETDRTETCNLAADNPEIVQELSSAWRDWAQRTELP